MTGHLAIAEALTRAVTGGDAQALEALYAEDAAVWHSYDRKEQSKAENVAALARFFAVVRELRYDNIVRHAIADGFVQQHVLAVTLKDGTRLADRPVCMVARIADGLIERLDEYVEARRALD